MEIPIAITKSEMESPQELFMTLTFSKGLTTIVLLTFHRKKSEKNHLDDWQKQG
jgi:hypothetical protein